MPLQKTRAGNPSLTQRVTTALTDGTYSTETWKHQIIFIVVWIYIPKRRVGPTNWLKRVYKSRRVPTLFTRCVARQRSPLHEGVVKLIGRSAWHRRSGRASWHYWGSLLANLILFNSLFFVLFPEKIYKIIIFYFSFLVPPKRGKHWYIVGRERKRRKKK